MMDLAAVVTEDWEEVLDPGGGEVDRFIECAIEIDALITQLAAIL